MKKLIIFLLITIVITACQKKIDSSQLIECSKMHALVHTGKAEGFGDDNYINIIVDGESIVQEVYTGIKYQGNIYYPKKVNDNAYYERLPDKLN